MSDGIKPNERIDRSYPGSYPLRFSDDAVGFLVAAIDAISIASAGVAASVAYNLFAGGNVDKFDAFLGLGTVAAILYVFVAKAWGLYGFSILLGYDQRWSRLVLSWLLVILLLVLFLFLLKIGAAFSRGTVLLYGVLGPVFLIATRAITARYLRAAFERGTTVGRRAVVIGDRDQLAALTRLDLARRFAITELGRFTLLSAAQRGPTFASGERGAIDNAIDLARREMADEVVLAVSWDDVRRLDALRDHLRVLPLPVRLLPDCTVAEILSVRFKTS
jgi:undecaprenyl-phosphate galactose phosphotransferase/putative colanic acid biosynthesis UDP-glucose lipid carrier transferase